jgi:fimbrial chaperone protein
VWARGAVFGARCGCILAAALAAAAPAAAGSFSLSPIRVELGAGHPRVALTLHNDDSEPVTVEVASVAWSQSAGADEYAPTRDLIVTPPVFVVPPNSQQIVRVALREDADASTERAYRIFFEEVPTQLTKTFNGLHVALRVGVPVFVAPKAKAAPALVWRAQLTPTGEMQIEARNQGSAHLQVTDFAVRFGSQPQPMHVAGAKYILPDSTAIWTLRPPAGVDPNAALHLSGFSDQGDISAEIARVGS